MTIFHILIIPLSLNVTLFSKCLYLTAHIKINYEKIALEGFLNKHRHVSRTTAKMELFVALALWQRLTNLTKYFMTSDLESSCVLRISSYLAKQTLFTSSFFSSY